MILKWRIYSFLIFAFLSDTCLCYKRVCYHTNWAQYRPTAYKFIPENIDPFLCTHIIYSFGKVVGNTIGPYEWNDETDWSPGNYEKTADLKAVNPKLKILLAIGGWTHGSGPFTALVDNTADMETFASNAIAYLRVINFDGLDLDWEYPANRGSPPEDKARFTEFCQILRKAFEEESRNTGKERLLLTAAVAAGEGTVMSAYEIDLIAQELDFINLMSYDLHGSWESFLGHNSPLYARSDETGEQRTLNQDYAVQLWLKGNTPREKLIMGMGLYGRSFKMGSSSHALGSSASGAGTAGLYTREKGFLAYYEICQNLASGWTRVWSDEHKVPYAYRGDQWVGYDDQESIEIKANYVKQHGLGGSMVWAMDLDDFQNSCGYGVSPLMTKLLQLLPDDESPITAQPTQAPTTVKPTKATTAQPTQVPTTQPTKASTDPPTKVPTAIPSTQPPSTGEFKRVCYHTNWAQYRSEPYKFVPKNIDPFLCTHIIYSFGKVEGNTIAPYEWNDETEWSPGNYEKTADLKKQNPKLKILLAIGGWTHGSDPFTALVDNPVDMETFASNAIIYLRRINFDGLDLDWEYPANRGSPPEDKTRFTEFCKILRRAFELESQQSGRNTLLLTAAVAAGEGTVTSAYEIDLIAKQLDFINLMSYDLHGSWESFLGHNSPLFSRADETDEQKTLNQDYAVRLWLKGTPKEKLIMGIGLYGRSFKMGSTSHALGSPASGAGSAGTYTGENGFLAFYEVCKNLADGWTRVWNDEHKVPYAYKGNQWVGYDDLESIEIKANYIKQHGLGGSMVWAMDLDDFRNTCGLGVNPLMSKLKIVLSDNNNVQSTQAQTTAPTTKKPTTSQPTNAPTTASPTKMPTTVQPTKEPTTVQPTTVQPTKPSTTQPTTTTKMQTKAPTTKNPNQCGPPDNCPGTLYFGDPCDATIFYQCWNGIAHKKQCNPPLVWDASTNNCNWDYLVNPTKATNNLCDPPQCAGIEFHADPCDDQSYYHCGHGIPYRYTCQDGTLWDTSIDDCNYEDIVTALKCGPTNCENGKFYADTCFERVYYQCWNDKAYRNECSVGTKWDSSVNNCVWAR